MKIAYFSPFPPARSGIADYSRELLPELAARADVHLFAPEGDAGATWNPRLPCFPVAAYAERRWHYDATLYHMGNSSHHEGLYRVMRRYPGVMVLHDYVLHHFVADRTAGRENYAGYVRELAYSLGPEGSNLAWSIRHGRAEHPLASHPLNRRLLDLNLGTLVHSDYARSLVATQAPAARARVVPALVTPHAGRPRRAALPWPEDALIFASFGQITHAKRLDQALRAFARVRRRLPAARYLLVGDLLPEVALSSLIADLALEGAVHHVGFSPDLQRFVDWLHTADVVLNLRHPTLGETSAAALRALAAGRPLIVYDQGWYAELPETVALKVPPLAEEALVQAMLTLGQDPARRAQMGSQARAHVAAEHAPDVAADAYVTAIREIIAEVTARG